MTSPVALLSERWSTGQVILVPTAALRRLALGTADGTAPAGAPTGAGVGTSQPASSGRLAPVLLAPGVVGLGRQSLGLLLSGADGGQLAAFPPNPPSASCLSGHPPIAGAIWPLVQCNILVRQCSDFRMAKEWF